MTSNKIMRRCYLLLAFVTLATQVASAGEPEDYDAAPDSPLWWTLSDSVDPTKLRGALLDPTAARERYRVATLEGAAEPLDESRLREVSFFVDGTSTPELVPMWLALNGIAWQLQSGRESSATSKRLSELVSEQGIALIRREVDTHLREVERVGAEIGPDQQEFASLLRETRQGGSAEDYRRARRGEVSRISAKSKPDDDRLQNLYRNWRRDPIRESIAFRLSVLRANLTKADWSGLRGFLLREVAPQTSLLDYYD